MSIAKPQLLAEKGKFKTWCVEIIDDSTGNSIGTKYEVRKGDVVLDQFDNEREALEEMLLQDRIAVQNRPSGPGM